jgi:hypothetical protein
MRCLQRTGRAPPSGRSSAIEWAVAGSTMAEIEVTTQVSVPVELALNEALHPRALEPARKMTRRLTRLSRIG